MKGFSVAQLLIVLGIIVIVYAVTFPSLTDYTNNLELRNATKKFVVNLKLAQQYAITEQVKHSIRFNILDDSYSVVKKDEPEVILENYSFNDDIFFASQSGLTNSEVIYNSGGSVDYSGFIYLTHQSTTNQTVINIKPSGYVTWQTFKNPE